MSGRILGIIVLAVAALVAWKRPKRTASVTESALSSAPQNDHHVLQSSKDEDRSAREHAPVLRTFVIVLSFIASACAVVFTVHQLNVSRHAMMAQAWQNLMHPGYEISRIFVDRPNLRPYFYEGKACPATDRNYHRVMALCEMHLDFFESFTGDYVYKLPEMAFNEKSRHLWEKYFRDMFAMSPALRQFARERQDWYSMDFSEYCGPEKCEDLPEK